MNTHKIKINFKINAILAGDSDVFNSEITKQEIIEILLKKNTNMKNKLLKIRNEMKKNEKDTDTLLEQISTKENLSQGRNDKIFKNKNIYMQWNKLCKLNKFKESDHHRSLITYDDNLTNNNVNNEVKNAYYNKVIQIRKVMDKRKRHIL